MPEQQNQNTEALQEACASQRQVRCRNVCITDPQMKGKKGAKGSFRCIMCSRQHPEVVPDVYVKTIDFHCPCCHGHVRKQRIKNNSSKLLPRILVRAILIEDKVIQPVLLSKLIPVLMILEQGDLSTNDILFECGSTRFSHLKQAEALGFVTRESIKNGVGRPTVRHKLTLQGRNLLQKVIGY
ncbi:MAG: hypothetical protein HMLIMOIP_001688 [Candidatus Nitrosomirales archaeon]|jgi:hypothetical protein